VTDSALAQLELSAAEGVIENLRYGIPPQGYVRLFTVGRAEELDSLRQSLANAKPHRGAALLVRANYGAGKSHLLQVVREMALQSRYAVSLVVVNAQQGVRFNRMDTILGAVAARLEVPGGSGIGIGELFNAFANRQRETRGALEISNRNVWDYSDALKAPGVFVGLRAWVNSSAGPVRDLVHDWLTNPAAYRTQRKLLYERLVAGLRRKFRDPRSDWQFYADEVFVFHTGGHQNAWGALGDFDFIARASGFRGLVLLFDEFEDVIQNLNRRDYQQEAFLNLFRFFGGQRFPGMGYFAVTPDFVVKCKVELMSRGVRDFDYKRFEELPSFAMGQISEKEFLELARRIRLVHGIALNWDARALISDRDLRKLADRLWAVESPERVRSAIEGLVRELDDRFEET
jgi:hypothetical protein